LKSLWTLSRTPGTDGAGGATGSAAGAAIIVALVAVVVTVWREADVERQAAPPGKKAVTLFGDDVERGVRFVLDGRVLTVSLLPPVRDQSFETVEGARITATCGAPPGDPRRETTLEDLGRLKPLFEKPYGRVTAVAPV
jgi:hypothetical protein